MKIRQLVMTVGALAALSTAPQAQAQLPACSAGTAQSFGATGAVQSYTIPPGATSLVIIANGASGGKAKFAFAPRTGAHIAALVPAPSLAMLNVIVGVAGGSSGSYAGGGGGGSFVYTPSGTLLVAAGGGGGAGYSDSGNDAQLGQNGGNAVVPPAGAGGAGGTAGDGGVGGISTSGYNGGGGGGFLSAGIDGVDGLSGKGGDRISSPGDAAGGAGSANGGFGGGGGAGQTGGGGGGGYSGGGGGGLGEHADGAGGGGSFVTTNGTTLESAMIDGLGNGRVTICAILRSAPTLSPWALGLLTLVLTGLGLGCTARKL